MKLAGLAIILGQIDSLVPEHLRKCSLSWLCSCVERDGWSTSGWLAGSERESVHSTRHHHIAVLALLRQDTTNTRGFGSEEWEIEANAALLRS
jgi:hypothetical protein